VTGFVGLAWFFGVGWRVRTEFVAGPRSRGIPLISPEFRALLRGLDGEMGSELQVVAENGFALPEELGDAASELARDGGGLDEAVGGGGDDDFGGGAGASGADGVGGALGFGVEDGDVDGGDPAQVPLGVGELMDEADLVVIAGQKAVGDFVDELVVGAGVLHGEDGGAARVAAVFETVHAGTQLALRGFGAADAFAVFALRRLRGRGCRGFVWDGRLGRLVRGSRGRVLNVHESVPPIEAHTRVKGLLLGVLGMLLKRKEK